MRPVADEEMALWAAMPTVVLQKGSTGNSYFPRAELEKNLTELPGEHFQTTHAQDVPSIC